MKKPPLKGESWWQTGLRDCYYSAKIPGWNVKARFFDQGIWHENYIPKELEEQNFQPLDDKFYNIWYLHISSGDSMDEGHEKLFYIEEM